MFEARNLECVKGYDSLFSGVNFMLNAGDVLRINGSNGSGKTSLLRILTGISQAETGKVLWQGQNIDAAKENEGEPEGKSFKQSLLYIGHKNGLKGELSALENLTLSRAYLSSGTSLSAEAALAAVGLGGYEHILAHQLSAGQKRRVSLARLYLSSAPLWILDEPTTAIDAQGVAAFQKLVKAHTQKNETPPGMVIYTSHQDLHFGGANCRALSLS